MSLFNLYIKQLTKLLTVRTIKFSEYLRVYIFLNIQLPDTLVSIGNFEGWFAFEGKNKIYL